MSNDGMRTVTSLLLTLGTGIRNASQIQSNHIPETSQRAGSVELVTKITIQLPALLLLPPHPIHRRFHHVSHQSPQ